MKAVTRDGRSVECASVDEAARGVVLRDREGEQVGYVPYENFRYAVQIRTPVSSASLRSVGYDDEDGTLELEFHGGGVYEYFDVPGRVYRDLLRAESKGRFFHDEIRGKFDYRRLA